MPETLDKFVSRIMKEKQLTLSDVELAAQGAISDSYICSIMNGEISNVSIRKLKALARGLGVEDIHLLSAACEVIWPHTADFYESKFGELFSKYQSLSKTHKEELLTILTMLDREIDRRLLEKRH